jgi:hypothetical protein
VAGGEDSSRIPSVSAAGVPPTAESGRRTRTHCRLGSWRGRREPSRHGSLPPCPAGLVPASGRPAWPCACADGRPTPSVPSRLIGDRYPGWAHGPRHRELGYPASPQVAGYRLRIIASWTQLVLGAARDMGVPPGRPRLFKHHQQGYEPRWLHGERLLHACGKSSVGNSPTFRTTAPRMQDPPFLIPAKSDSPRPPCDRFFRSGLQCLPAPR